MSWVTNDEQLTCSYLYVKAQLLTLPRLSFESNLFSECIWTHHDKEQEMTAVLGRDAFLLLADGELKKNSILFFLNVSFTDRMWKDNIDDV